MDNYSGPNAVNTFLVEFQREGYWFYWISPDCNWSCVGMHSKETDISSYIWNHDQRLSQMRTELEASFNFDVVEVNFLYSSSGYVVGV